MTDPRFDPSRVIRAPRGTRLSCKSWLTEAPYRMLQNNLDPEVAENPAELVVYGGIGRAARDWDCYDAILETLKTLGDDETLLIQSGKPVGVFPTHADAPRVLIANSNLVPHWATWEHFNELDRKGLMMYGQMTAGSWIYIGSQGIVQGTYETFVEMGRQHYGGNLTGKWILTAGLGGMGGAQPLAATWPARAASTSNASRPASTCACARATSTSRRPTSTTRSRASRSTPQAGEAKSIALLGNAAEILPRTGAPRRAPGLRSPTRPARTIRCTATCRSAGPSSSGWPNRRPIPTSVRDAAKKSMRVHVEAMLAFQQQGIPTFDYGNNIRQMAKDEGCTNAFDFPGFVPAYVRPLFCRGIGPFRWVALSGDPEDIYKTDAKVKELIPDDAHLHRWLDMARERISFQGLPARICWVGLGLRHKLGLAFNEMVRNGELKAPIVIGRDHLDSRQRGLAQPRNRSDEGRQRCGLRLAAAQRDAERRRWRDLGRPAPRRRRRHGLLAAQRRGDRVRRHAGSRQAHRARAVERSRHRRDAACGCGLRDREGSVRRSRG